MTYKLPKPICRDDTEHGVNYYTAEQMQAAFEYGQVETSKLGRCGTCQHWQRYIDEFDVIRYGAHVGKCKSDHFVYGQETPKNGLRYWDYEGYVAGFETGESFGCVHWVAKDMT